MSPLLTAREAMRACFIGTVGGIAFMALVCAFLP